MLDFGLREVEVSKDVFSLGRKSGNDRVVSANKVSAAHCAVSRERAGRRCNYYLEDFSSNGTFCNGKKVHRKKVPIKDQDEISLLRTDLKSDKSLYF